ncbi:F-box domain protein [Ascosphaera apis ARSEF 7405]|uniref:F-box domain protein n=1 Tax=Ascosphaera apis ARSEF 7405 TaxID=392613 RepID=A0A162IFP1_9EURO|nr:F-box domain protein [Ascosphaera apis ARSEF 7405]
MSSSAPSEEPPGQTTRHSTSEPMDPRATDTPVSDKDSSESGSPTSPSPEPLTPSQDDPSRGVGGSNNAQNLQSSGTSQSIFGHSTPSTQSSYPHSSRRSSFTTCGNRLRRSFLDDDEMSSLTMLDAIDLVGRRQTVSPVVDENEQPTPRPLHGPGEDLVFMELAQSDYTEIFNPPVQDKTRLDPFKCLPLEMSLQVLRYFSSHELWRLSQVCQLWRYLCQDPQLLTEINMEENYRQYPGAVIIRQIESAGSFLRKLKLCGCKQLEPLWAINQHVPLIGGRIQSLSIMHCGLTRPMAKAFLNSNPHLKKLELPGSKYIDSQAVTAISCLGNLEWLDLSCSRISSTADLSEVAKNCPKLKYFRLACVRGVHSFSTIMEQFWKLNSLETLDLSKNRHLTDDDLRILTYGVPHVIPSGDDTPKTLKTLRIPHCGHVSLIGIECLIRHCPKMEALDITKTRTLTDHQQLKNILTYTPDLKEFSCRESSAVTNEVLHHLSRQRCARTLEKLDIGNSWGIEDSGVLAILRKCPNLRYLSIDTTDVTDTVIFEASVQVLNKGFTTNKRPKIAMVIDCFGCYELTWAAVEQTMVTNSHEIDLHEKDRQDYQDLSRLVRGDPDEVFNRKTDFSSLSSYLRRVRDGEHSVYPAHILQLNCNWEYRDAMKAHSSLLLAGERERARRFQTRWTEFTRYHDGMIRYGEVHAIWELWRSRLPGTMPTMNLPPPATFSPIYPSVGLRPNYERAAFTLVILEHTKEYEEDDKVFPPGLNKEAMMHGRCLPGPHCAAIWSLIAAAVILNPRPLNLRYP